MELGQFNFEINRLRDRYGKSKYPEVLVDILYKKFRKVDYESFKKAVNKLMAYEQYAPMYPKFADELLPELARIKEQEIEELKKLHNCFSCNNTGRISINLKENEAAYSFRCNCALGEILFPNFPKHQGARSGSH